MNHRPFSAKWLVGIALMGLSLTACDSDTALMPDTAIESRITTTPPSDGHITAAEAQNVAATHYAQRNNGVMPFENRSSDEPQAITNQKGETLAWIVNHEEGGWAIVSATRNYFPVLAYSDNGNLAINGQMAETGFSTWIAEIDDAITASQNFDDQTITLINQEWRQYEPAMATGGLPEGNSPEAVACRTRLKELNDTYYQDGWTFTTLPSASITIPESVYNTANSCGSPVEYTIVGVKDMSSHLDLGPLMTTCWRQNYGFNAMCPHYDASNPQKYPAGCVAIAMAQIMKYHRSPATFDWDAMDDFAPTAATQYLIADIAKTIKTEHTETQSYATLDNAINGFSETYGYTVSKKDHKASDVINEIVGRHRPVYMRGESASGGKHAWVCDGVSHIEYRYDYYVEYLCNGSYDNLGSSMQDPYQTGNYSFPYYFYMNWGNGYTTEEGKANGWYLDTELPTYRNYKNNRKNLYVSK